MAALRFVLFAVTVIYVVGASERFEEKYGHPHSDHHGGIDGEYDHSHDAHHDQDRPHDYEHVNPGVQLPWMPMEHRRLDEEFEEKYGHPHSDHHGGIDGEHDHSHDAHHTPTDEDRPHDYEDVNPGVQLPWKPMKHRRFDEEFEEKYGHPHSDHHGAIDGEYDHSHDTHHTPTDQDRPHDYEHVNPGVQLPWKPMKTRRLDEEYPEPEIDPSEPNWENPGHPETEYDEPCQDTPSNPKYRRYGGLRG